MIKSIPIAFIVGIAAGAAISIAASVASELVGYDVVHDALPEAVAGCLFIPETASGELEAEIEPGLAPMPEPKPW